MLLHLSILAASLTVAHADEPKILSVDDVVYAKRGDRELKLDIVRPDGPGPYPAVVCIHGGGWSSGRRRDMRFMQEALARRGYVTISPEYRFAPKDLWPAQVHDVKAAVRWLRSHASEYHVDAEKFGATGISAGGHLSVMLGVLEPKDGLEGEAAEGSPPSRVQAVVNIVGPVDLAAADIPDQVKPIVTNLLGGPAASKVEVAASASPATFITRDDAPMLSFYGSKDPLVPPSQGTILGAKMSAAGVPGRVELMVGAGHGPNPDDVGRMIEATGQFFDKYLKPSKK